MTSPYRALGLSKNATKVLGSVQTGLTTPVQIAKETGLSRPAIYAILAQLEEQGLIRKDAYQGKRSWSLAPASQINTLLDDAREELLGSRKEKEAMYREDNVEVKVYRGAKTIDQLFRKIFQGHRGETCIGLQGDNVYADWRDLLGLEAVNDLNKSIKKDRMVIQAIVPEGNFERVVDTMGFEWARHFEGRAYRVNEIDDSYFKHKGEMFLFKDSAYLISMGEALVIEIKHSHIQKLLLSLIHYVQDSSRVIDGNEILRELMKAKTS